LALCCRSPCHGVLGTGKSLPFVRHQVEPPVSFV